MTAKRHNKAASAAVQVADMSVQDRIFTFVLTPQEVANLRSQIATSSLHGGRRYSPRVFTEHGTLMAANALNSKRAVEMSVFVVRAFTLRA